jgi:hypothetical protein
MSAIDPTVPVYGQPTTQSVRDNFAVAAGEITALEDAVAALSAILGDITDLPDALAGMLPLTGGTLTGPLLIQEITPSGPLLVTLNKPIGYDNYVRFEQPGGIPNSWNIGANVNAIFTIQSDGDPPAFSIDAVRDVMTISSATLLVPPLLERRAGGWNDTFDYGTDSRVWQAPGGVPLMTLGPSGALATAGPLNVTGGISTSAGINVTGQVASPPAPTASTHLTNKAYVDAADALALPRTGGMLSGPLVLAGDPTEVFHAATKQYVDASLATGLAYQGTWAVAANSPDLTTVPVQGGFRWLCTTANPAISETPPVAIPGLTGRSISDGDFILWDAAVGQFNLIASGGLTKADADSLYLSLGGGTLNSGISFGSNLATGTTDFSNHLSLWGGVYGISVTGSRLNLVTGASVVMALGTSDVATFNAAGLTMAATRSITLSADPTTALHAATKQYVDTATPPTTVVPVIDGAVAIGTDTGWARGDHTHPTALNMNQINVTAGSLTLTIAQVRMYLLYFYGTPTAPLTVTFPVGTSPSVVWQVLNVTGQNITLAGVGGGTVLLPPNQYREVWTDRGGLYPLNTVTNTPPAADNSLVVANTAWTSANFLRLTGGTISGALTVFSGLSLPSSTFTCGATSTFNNAATFNAGVYIGSPTSSTGTVVLQGAADFNKSITWRSTTSAPFYTWRMLRDDVGDDIYGDFEFVSHYPNVTVEHIIFHIDRVTGLATVGNDPTAPLGIATKQYVDNNPLAAALAARVAALEARIAA